MMYWPLFSSSPNSLASAFANDTLHSSQLGASEECTVFHLIVCIERQPLMWSARLSRLNLRELIGFRSLAVTALVFSARSARARIVAANLVGLALDRRRTLLDRLVAVAHHDFFWPLLLLLDLCDVFFASHLHRKYFLDDVLLHRAHHRLKHLESFFLIFDQGILLPVATQPDAFLQMIHREQMILPQ